MGNVELIEKLGRNDLCPCGSGRRYKRCCLKSGKYDGSIRNYYFQGAPVIRRFRVPIRRHIVRAQLRAVTGVP